jgi:multiple sugar transport system ATP-binding protein
MGFSLKLRGERRDVIERKVMEAAVVLGLEEYLDRFPRQLSGGQRQRVAMGRSIVRDPRVFLFDEPLSNLDARLRVQMRAEIKTLHQRLRTTTVYVTHDQIEAMTMADRIVVLKNGRVEQVGGPLELYDRPANTFVAGFIGSPAMNLLDDLPAGAAPGLRTAPKGRDVVYGVRPEHVALVSGGEPANVVLVEPTGPETQVTLRLGDHDLLAVIRERTALRPGDMAHVSIDPRQVHLFDRVTGQRIP